VKTAMHAERARGFSLVELLMVLVVAAVLATIALPNLRDVVVRTRLKTAATDLHASLLLARSEAIKRNAGMQVVPVDATNWTQGWSVRVQAAGTVLTKQDAYQSLNIATTNAAYAAAAVPSVTFSGTGRESGSAGAGIAFVISSATYPSIAARCVAIDPSGRAAVRMDTNGNAADGCN
jgi:type IV fimbrial biogenesis protein FimT